MTSSQPKLAYQQFRLSVEEKAILKALALKKRQSVSVFLRKAILDLEAEENKK